MRYVELIEAYQYEMFPPDSLYHTTSPASAFEILTHQQLRPRDEFISFSLKPHLYDIREHGAVLVFDLRKLYSQVEPVEYTEAWAEAHPDQVRYIAGEGWSEQFEYTSDENDEWDQDAEYEQAYAEAELDAFLHKADEEEWISLHPGQPVQFTPDAVTGLILDEIDAETQQELQRLGYSHIRLRQV
jgi:hypothetical protein